MRIKKLLCPIYRAIEYAQIIIGRVLCLYPIDRSSVFSTLLDESEREIIGQFWHFQTLYELL